MLENSTDFWAEAWTRHSANYYHTIPRQAYYLNCVLGRSDRKLLEIGAGSYRDCVRLNQWGYDCEGTDFSELAALKAREQYPDHADKLHRMDASQLEFEDQAFDVSFHNGFFVLFDDATITRDFISEQIRVTRRMIVCTVHNGLNQSLVRDFQERSEEDALYDIRFFVPDEMKALLEPFCSKVKVYPFGLPLHDQAISRTRSRKLLRMIYPLNTPGQLPHAERLMVVGWLP